MIDPHFEPNASNETLRPPALHEYRKFLPILPVPRVPIPETESRG